MSLKQPVLKPQDLVVALKLVVLGGGRWTFAKLAQELGMSASEVHASVQRGLRSHILVQSEDDVVPNKSSLHEFLVHGLKYVFSAAIGGFTRGMPTGVSAFPLNTHFERGSGPEYVWPDPNGDKWGIEFCPLFPSVPIASRYDNELYEILALVDALRGGAARERAMAETMLLERLA